MPGITACSLCVGETLGEGDLVEGSQLERLRRIELSRVARLALSECLDECDRGDVVVARPSPQGRQARVAPVWFERLAGDDLTEQLSDWLARGGPGLAELPPELGARVIQRDGSGGTAGRSSDPGVHLDVPGKRRPAQLGTDLVLPRVRRDQVESADAARLCGHREIKHADDS